MILRRIARPLLAAIFVSGGINQMRQLEGHTKVAEPLLNKVIGQKSGSSPEGVPTDARTLVRIDAMVKIGAGAALAFGRFPRLASLLLLGSLVPTTVAGHPFWEEEDPGQRDAQLVHFLKNAGIAGGLLLAAADTEGKPSVAWHARHTARLTGKHIEGVTRTAQRNVRHAQRRSQGRARRARKAVGNALPR